MVFAQDPFAGQSQPQSPPTTASNAVTVQGTVRNSATGDPLPRALVQIEGDAETSALTDGDGRFEIPGVAAGQRTIRIVKPGFRDRPYPTEENGPQAEGPAHSVLVAAQMPDLAFALAPNSAIHGRIELSTGDPGAGIPVLLFRQLVRFGRNGWSVEGNTRTDGDGSYRFGGLSDGVYLLQTQPTLESEPAVNVVAPGSGTSVLRNGYASVFYPDARDLAGASRIQLSGGSQAEANFSLVLEPFYAVTAFAGRAGGISGPGGGAGSQAQQASYSATVMDSSGQMTPYAAQYDSATHSLQASLPNGSYTLVARADAAVNSFQADGLIQLSNAGSRGSVGAVDFTVAGHAVTGLRIPIGAQPLATVHLRLVHNADNPNATPVQTAAGAQLVNLNLEQASGASSNGPESTLSMTSQPDSISFTAQPGLYWLSVTLAQKGLCAGSLTAGGANLAREPLALSLATAPPPMDLTLRDDCGTLALALPATLATSLPGDEPYYTVYIVPDFDTVQDIAPLHMHPSWGPSLTIDGLTPGSYHVYAFDSPVHLEYRDPAALAAQSNAGQQVTISPGVTANLVLEGLEH